MYAGRDSASGKRRSVSSIASTSNTKKFIERYPHGLSKEDAEGVVQEVFLVVMNSLFSKADMKKHRLVYEIT